MPVLAKYEPTIRSQVAKYEELTHETSEHVAPSKTMKFGLAFAEKGHLMYVWNGGPFQWVPYRMMRAFVRVWNHVICFIRGHDTFGPITDEDGTWIAHKTCMHCSKIWPNER